MTLGKVHKDEGTWRSSHHKWLKFVSRVLKMSVMAPCAYVVSKAFFGGIYLRRTYPWRICSPIVCLAFSRRSYPRRECGVSARGAITDFYVFLKVILLDENKTFLNFLLKTIMQKSIIAIVFRMPWNTK